MEKSWQKKLLEVTSKLEHAFDKKKLAIKNKAGLVDDLRIQAYRGYGNSKKLHITGRVIEKRGTKTPEADDSVLNNMLTLFHRYESDEIPAIDLGIKVGDKEFDATTDDEGYFTLDIENPTEGENSWLSYTAYLKDNPYQDEKSKNSGKLIIQNPKQKLGVISDLDDTVVVSQATNFLEKSKILLLNNEHTRKPFAGVAKFYQALAKGKWEKPDVPFFYVSSSSWNLYDMFYNFCKINQIPQGCFLLRDVGLDENKFYRSSHGSHKKDKIEAVLKTFGDTKFIFIGDSGQHDPEIYRDLAKEYAGQMEAVYIRDVHPEKDKTRDEQVKLICKETERLGVPMLQVADSYQAAKDAFSRGFIEEKYLMEIKKETEKDDKEEEEESKIKQFLGLN